MESHQPPCVSARLEPVDRWATFIDVPAPVPPP